MLAKAEAGRHALLVADTGAGKTLAGFLPTLCDFAPSRGAPPADGLHTLYVSPLKALALQRLRDFRKATGGAIPLVGVGGIASAADAWERIRAGASLVQLYSALVYEGPGLGARIARGLIPLMQRDGFASIAEAVGSE